MAVWSPSCSRAASTCFPFEQSAPDEPRPRVPRLPFQGGAAPPRALHRSSSVVDARRTHPRAERRARAASSKTSGAVAISLPPNKEMFQLKTAHARLQKRARPACQVCPLASAPHQQAGGAPWRPALPQSGAPLLPSSVFFAPRAPPGSAILRFVSTGNTPRLSATTAMPLDHVALKTRDFFKAKTFYLRALAPLGYVQCAGSDDWKTCGLGVDGRADFFIGQGTPHSPTLHFAFAAESRDLVDQVRPRIFVVVRCARAARWQGVGSGPRASPNRRKRRAGTHTVRVGRRLGVPSGTEGRSPRQRGARSAAALSPRLLCGVFSGPR